MSDEQLIEIEEYCDFRACNNPETFWEIVLYLRDADPEINTEELLLKAGKIHDEIRKLYRWMSFAYYKYRKNRYKLFRFEWMPGD